MEEQLVICPVCNKNVRSRIINEHLDEGCSTPSQGSPKLASMTKKKPQKPTAMLAPIFSSSSKVKNVPNQSQSPRIQSADALDALSSQHKRPIDVDSPIPAPKRTKSMGHRTSVPLAEKLRPKQFSDFIGQAHLLVPGSLLSTMLRTNATWSIIFWGPPGCGKTTLAKLIAERSDAVFKELSATASGVNEVKAVVEEARRVLSLLGRRTVLFLDEIHRFNKAQQDVFLPFVEQGLIQLIGATTENPSFRLTGALISRCRILRLESLSDEHIGELLERSLLKMKEGDGNQRFLDVGYARKSPESTNLPTGIMARIVSMAGGDARTALSLLEVVLQSPEDASEKQVVEALKQSLVVSYDRTGDDHYDMISALHKSVRGSNGNAAMYWLARMLTAGEDPLFIARRLVVCASEDIGLADNRALPLAMTTLQACQVIGMPECRINLAHLVAYLSEAPKSTRAYEAYRRAEEAAKRTANAAVPMQVRNGPTALMEDIGCGKNYHYNPDYRHPVFNQYLPTGLEDTNILRGEGDTEGKVWDEQALCEWEVRENRGQKWEGRSA